MIKVRSGGAWRDQYSRPMNKTGGGWRYFQNVYRRQGGAWVLVWTAYIPPITVSATNVNGTFSSATAGNKSIGNSTATASGGSGALSYSCTRISGGQLTATVSGNSATFRINVPKAGVSPGDGSEVWRWSVTDGTRTSTADITVTYRDLG